MVSFPCMHIFSNAHATKSVCCKPCRGTLFSTRCLEYFWHKDSRFVAIWWHFCRCCICSVSGLGLRTCSCRRAGLFFQRASWFYKFIFSICTYEPVTMLAFEKANHEGCSIQVHLLGNDSCPHARVLASHTCMLCMYTSWSGGWFETSSRCIIELSEFCVFLILGMMFTFLLDLCVRATLALFVTMHVWAFNHTLDERADLKQSRCASEDPAVRTSAILGWNSRFHCVKQDMSFVGLQGMILMAWRVTRMAENNKATPGLVLTIVWECRSLFFEECVHCCFRVHCLH